MKLLLNFVRFLKLNFHIFSLPLYVHTSRIGTLSAYTVLKFCVRDTLCMRISKPEKNDFVKNHPKVHFRRAWAIS